MCPVGKFISVAIFFLDGKHNIERLNDIDVITTSNVTHFYDLLSGSPNTLVTS